VSGNAAEECCIIRFHMGINGIHVISDSILTEPQYCGSFFADFQAGDKNV
jgi:hypothetical protein